MMSLAKKKFERFLKDGHTRVFIYELSHGYTWSRANMERTPFVNSLDAFMEEINEGRNMERQYLAQLATHGDFLVRDDKMIVWMDEPLRWTTWVDQ